MANCERAHARFDKVDPGKIHVGELPDWTRVRGKVAWSLFRGEYSGLPEAWVSFAARAMPAGPAGPAGDVYLCTVGEHDPDRLLTILYLPLH